MLARIFKYPLQTYPGVSVVRLVKGAVVLTANLQRSMEPEYDHATLNVWVKVDAMNTLEYEDREFGVVGTGHMWDDEVHRYVATVYEPPFVWHVLERIKGP